LPVDDLDGVTDRALERGRRQLGSLGSGNHFLEVQEVERVIDAGVARRFGLAEGSVTVMIHSGSRGLGHQICSDHVEQMLRAMPEYGIKVAARQRASAPVRSRHGMAYLTAMTAAANFGRANRQVISEAARSAFGSVLGDRSLRLVYDVSHNLAKLEEHEIDGQRRGVLGDCPSGATGPPP